MHLPIKIVSSEGKQESQQGGAIVPQVHQCVSIDLSVRLPHEELAKLNRGIEAQLPGNPHRVVQFISAYAGEGVSTIAFETAVIAAMIMGKRVLFIDTGTPHADSYGSLLEATTEPLDTLLLAGRPPYEAIARAEGTELYITRLRSRDESGYPASSLRAVEQVVENLRGLFDLIIIDSPGILRDAFAIALSKLADGSVLVVEAERTRAPVALEAKRVIESGGGRVIGSVLSKRRFYIPQFLYRLLYRQTFPI